jgi:pantoate--beta-alanine ligase
MKVVRTIAELQPEPGAGLVPTMGAFHDGHRALFRAARAENERVVASLFVNPAQFEEQADLQRYPRDEARDLEIAAAGGVDVVFAPAPEELYPTGFATWVEPHEAGAEGTARPGHFRGVATVCLKLFNLVRPARAYFGQKDAQQVAVVKRMVRDLDMPVRIEVLPTVRELDGLALSSRNRRLSPADRTRALALSRGLDAARAAYEAGERDAGALCAAAAATLDGLRPEYLAVVDPVTFAPLTTLDGPALVAIAACVGPVRLIDNVLLEPVPVATG